MSNKRLQDQLYVAFLKLVDAAIFGAAYAGALVGFGLIFGALFHWGGLSLDILAPVLQMATRPFLVLFAVITSLMWIVLLMGLGERK